MGSLFGSFERRSSLPKLFGIVKAVQKLLFKASQFNVLYKEFISGSRNCLLIGKVFYKLNLPVLSRV